MNPISFIIEKSGMEKKPRYLKGEMLMYELVMAVATKALATAGYACDLVATGEFKEASLQFKKAARYTYWNMFPSISYQIH